MPSNSTSSRRVFGVQSKKDKMNEFCRNVPWLSTSVTQTAAWLQLCVLRQNWSAARGHCFLLHRHLSKHLCNNSWWAGQLIDTCQQHFSFSPLYITTRCHRLFRSYANDARSIIQQLRQSTRGIWGRSIGKAITEFCYALLHAFYHTPRR